MQKQTMKVTLLDFLEVWQDLKCEDLSDTQLDALQEILECGLGEIVKERNKRKN